MNALFCSTVDENISAIRKIIDFLGITLQTGSRLRDFANIVSTQPLRHSLAPAFDPAKNCVAHKSVLWMAGYKEDGELVVTQAIKLVDLGTLNLQQYLERHIWEVHPFGFDPKVKETHCFLSKDCQEISGLITYHGELWLKGGPDGVRGGSLAVLVTRLLLLESLVRWSPDFLVGLQSPMTACRGLSIREGYMRLEQRSVLWYNQQNNDVLEGWIVWMSAEEAKFNLRVPAELFCDMFENNDELKNDLKNLLAA